MPIPKLSSSFGEVSVADGTNTALVGNTPPHYALSLYATNSNASLRYLQLYDKATAPSGSDRPIYSFPMPVISGNSPGEIIVDRVFFLTYPKLFTTGIVWAVSTANKTYTAATASEHNVHLHFY